MCFATRVFGSGMHDTHSQTHRGCVNRQQLTTRGRWWQMLTTKGRRMRATWKRRTRPSPTRPPVTRQVRASIADRPQVFSRRPPPRNQAPSPEQPLRRQAPRRSSPAPPLAVLPQLCLSESGLLTLRRSGLDSQVVSHNGVWAPPHGAPRRGVGRRVSPEMRGCSGIAIAELLCGTHPLSLGGVETMSEPDSGRARPNPLSLGVSEHDE